MATMSFLREFGGKALVTSSSVALRKARSSHILLVSLLASFICLHYSHSRSCESQLFLKKKGKCGECRSDCVEWNGSAVVVCVQEESRHAAMPAARVAGPPCRHLAGKLLCAPLHCWHRLTPDAAPAWKYYRAR